MAALDIQSVAPWLVPLETPGMALTRGVQAGSLIAQNMLRARQLQAERTEFMAELPLKAAEYEARAADHLLGAQAKLTTLRDQTEMKAAMIKYGSSATPEERSEIRPFLVTPAYQSAWQNFRVANITAENVNSGFSALGGLSQRAASMPDGWASPEIQVEFGKIVQKYPEVTNSPRFSEFERNIDAALMAKQKVKSMAISQGNLDVRKAALDLQKTKAAKAPANKDLERMESKRTELAGAMARIKSLREQLTAMGDNEEGRSTLTSQIVSATAQVPQLEAEIVELQRKLNEASKTTPVSGAVNPTGSSGTPSRSVMSQGGARVRTFNLKTGQFE